jgi:hypothetical protein
MDQHDLDALRRAIETLRSDPDSRDTIDMLLRDRGEEAAGLFASGFLQVKNLRLKPWEAPPCDSSNVKAPRDQYGCRANEIALLRRLLAAGLSRYEADPLQALAALEHAA